MDSVRSYVAFLSFSFLNSYNSALANYIGFVMEYRDLVWRQSHKKHYFGVAEIRLLSCKVNPNGDLCKLKRGSWDITIPKGLGGIINKSEKLTVVWSSTTLGCSLWKKVTSPQNSRWEWKVRGLDFVSFCSQN